MKPHIKIVALFVAFLIPLSIIADDYRINGYGNQPVIVKSTTNSQNAQIQTVNLATGSAVAIATGSDAGAFVISSTAYEASHVIKASGGTLVALIGYNSGPAQFIQVYNTAAVPSNGAVPIITFAVATTSNFSVTIPLTGLPLGTGISVSNSTTGPTRTAGASDTFFTGVAK